MKRRQSGEMLRGLQQWRSGHKLGFVYDEASTEKALEIAFRIIEGDPSAWSELDLRQDLLTNVIANLRSEGESALADRVEKVRFDFNESRYIKTQEKSMRIRGSELRKIIKEELRRSMIREGDNNDASGQMANPDEIQSTLEKGKIDRSDKHMPVDNVNAVREIQKILGLRVTGKWEPEIDISLWQWTSTNVDKMNIEGLDRYIFSNLKYWKWDKIAPKITHVNMKAVDYSPDAVGLLNFMKDLQTAYPDITKTWAKSDFAYK